MTAFKDWLNGLTSKTTPVDADEVYVRDSSGTPSSKKLTWANLKATISTYFGLIPSSNTLEQRNGTNAQTFRLYNTYTDASNYERGFMRWNSNALEIGAEAAGTGTARQLTFRTEMTGAAQAWRFYSPNSQACRILLQGFDRQTVVGGDANEFCVFDGRFSSRRDASSGAFHFLAVNGNETTKYFALSGVAAGVMQINNAVGTGSGNGAAVEMFEMTAPSAPATNGVRIYAEDNGSGKTRLMAQFATGAAVQIAIEP